MTAPEQMLKPCPFCGGEACFEQVGSFATKGGCAWSVGCCDEECHGFQSASTHARKSEAAAAWNTRPAPAELVEAQWQPIETAPEGNEETGPFFDVIWAGKNHRYLPVPARQIDCYRKRGSIKKQHGYPAVTTVFLDKPTHWMPRPDAPAALRNAGAAS